MLYKKDSEEEFMDFLLLLLLLLNQNHNCEDLESTCCHKDCKSMEYCTLKELKRESSCKTECNHELDSNKCCHKTHDKHECLKSESEDCDKQDLVNMLSKPWEGIYLNNHEHA